MSSSLRKPATSQKGGLIKTLAREQVKACYDLATVSWQITHQSNPATGTLISAIRFVTLNNDMVANY
jgi:hypothetical protein